MSEKRRRPPILRRTFGKHISEGQRQLWIAMLDRDLTQAQLGEPIGADSGLVNRWLYAVGAPGRLYLPRLQDVYGISVAAWSEPAKGAWPLPELEEMARAAKAA